MREEEFKEKNEEGSIEELEEENVEQEKIEVEDVVEEIKEDVVNQNELEQPLMSVKPLIITAVSSHVASTYTTDDYFVDLSCIKTYDLETLKIISEFNPDGTLITDVAGDGGKSGLYYKNKDLIMNVEPGDTLVLGSKMFQGLSWDIVEGMKRTIHGIRTITGLDLVDLTGVTSLSEMFKGDYSIHSIDFTGVDTSKIEDMSYMFDGCEFYREIDLSPFDTSSLTDMKGMFRDCIAISSINLSSFDTSQVTDMSYLFGTTSSSSVIFTTLKGTLDLTNFDTRNVTDMTQMFKLLRCLNAIRVSEDFVIAATNDNMFPSTPTTLKGNDATGFLTYVLTGDKCTVSFDSWVNDTNTGSRRSVQVLSGEDTLKGKTYQKGDLIVEPSFTINEKLHLDGWYTDSKYTNKWNFSTDTVQTNNLKLYAKWYANLTFDLGDASATWNITDPSKRLDMNVLHYTFNLPASNVASLSGYTLAGWTRDDLPEVHNCGESYDVFEDVVYKAKWNPVSLGATTTTTTTATSYRTSSSSGSDSSYSGGGGSVSGTKSLASTSPFVNNTEQAVSPEKAKPLVNTINISKTGETIVPVVDSTMSTWKLDPLTNTYKLEINISGQSIVNASNGMIEVTAIENQLINGVITPIQVNNTYCFDEQGNMLTGWVDVNGSKYFFDTDMATLGKEIKNTWKTIGNKNYYFDADGKMIFAI